MGIKGAFSKGFSQSARYYSRLIYLNSSAPFPSRVISIPIQKDKFHRVEVTSPATLHRHREMLANFYRCTRLSIGEQQNLVIYETMDSESTQGSNFLSISLNFRKLSVHASQLRTLSTVPDNRSLQTVKFEEWPRPNVSSFNLEILRNISSPSSGIHFPWNSNLFPSFIILLKISPMSFRIYTNFCISRASSFTHVIPRRVESDF